MVTRLPPPLFRRLELAFHTQYAEVRERTRGEGELLPGTPGTLTLRTGTGYGYWYRRYSNLPNQEAEDLVCKEGYEETRDAMQARIEFSTWVQEQVRHLRKLGMQVADKDVSRVLVELHNKQLFDGGLVVVGTLAFMAWLNELGAVAVSARTQDIDLARRQALKLGAPVSFLDALEATHLKFFPVPGMPNSAPSTSVKRPGADGLRVDLLTSGEHLGAVVPVPELSWHAQTVPHFDYLLKNPSQAAVLAGGHCIPVNLPLPERFVLHKLYSSTRRRADPAKARKDLVQAAVLAAVIVETDGGSLRQAAKDAPAEILETARTRLPALKELLQAHRQTLEEFERALSPAS
ncbi:MAG: hypothetical protein LH480_09285 [Rubrivivax sp.]|nr:hypothetical protein [Rubrivivax sp.]